MSRVTFAGAVLAQAMLITLCGSALAGPCATDHLPADMEKPGGFPARDLTLIVPYGSGGGSGQLARAMAQAVTELTGVGVDVRHVSGGSGTKGMDAYMAMPADGYTILEHVDDAASAHALEPSRPNPAVDLTPLVTAQVTFSQVYFSANEKRFSDWRGLIAYVRRRGGVARIANVSRQGSMERVNLKLVADHYGIKINSVSFATGAGGNDPSTDVAAHALLEQPGDVRSFLDSGTFRPVLTLLRDRVPAFADTPNMSDVGLEFEPLMRFRGFYAKKGIPKGRLAWLTWALQKAYCQASFQKFNEAKFMHLTESFRDTEGSIALITKTIETFRKVYEELGLKPK